MSAPMRLALEAAERSASGQGGPFGAVVVLPDGREVVAHNTVTLDSDPTAHAEVNAIRAAARVAGTHDLSGAVLYTSCAPCPMCLGAVLWARLKSIVYGASPEDAAAAGFDDAVFYRQMEGGLSTITSAAVLHEADEGAGVLAPFAAWRANRGRIDY